MFVLLASMLLLEFVVVVLLMSVFPFESWHSVAIMLGEEEE